MDDTPTPIAEIDHGPSKFEIFLEENQKLLIGGAVVIFLGVLGYVGFTSFAEMKAAEAGQALASAEESEAIEQVIAQHADSASAGSAALLLANQKADESNQAAIDALTEFVSNYPTHPALATATTNLGLRLINEGKLDEAQAQLETVEDIAGSAYILPIAKIGLGDIAKAKGDTELAKQHYNEVSNLVAEAGASSLENVSKFSGYTQIANSRLRLLTAVAPTEVEKKVDEPASVTPETAPTEVAETTPEASTTEAPAEPEATTPDAPAVEKTTPEENVEINSQASE